jgi:conjugal transfer pilus assembly protein TraF
VQGIIHQSLASKQSFFEERYRGWLWFEEAEQLSDLDKEKQQKAQNDITPSEAKAEIEEFAKALEELKFMMLARPTVQNIKAYKDKEKQMWDTALELHDNWDMTNLLHPEQRDLVNNPVNVHAAKAKRAIKREEDSKQIKLFATEFNLVLFFDESCKYCQLFSPVLRSFGADYGFNIEAVSRGDKKHEYFKTSSNNQLIEQLGITAFPTVIAISNDGQEAFELIRGYVSISELEEYSLLSIKHLAGDKQTGGNSKWSK